MCPGVEPSVAGGGVGGLDLALCAVAVQHGLGHSETEKVLFYCHTLVKVEVETRVGISL